MKLTNAARNLLSRDDWALYPFFLIADLERFRRTSPGVLVRARHYPTSGASLAPWRLMIRDATGQDVPAVLRLVHDLHASTKMAMPIDDDVVCRTLRGLILSPNGMLLVNGDTPNAFLAASVGYTTVSAAPVAQEHGWWAAPDAKGAGLRLLILYEQWAREKGCAFIRMSTPPHNERAAQILEKRGFFVSELAWAKAI